MGLRGNQGWCVAFLFSQQCDDCVGMAPRSLSLGILEKLLFIKPGYGYVLYCWYKVYYPSFSREEAAERTNSILWC